MSVTLHKQLQGMESYCIRAFAEALEVIPYTLAENAGLNPIEMVTELRNKHARGETSAGINVRKGQVTNMMEENVVQPLLVTTSAITLACECVRMILKVCRRCSDELAEACNFVFCTSLVIELSVPSVRILCGDLAHLQPVCAAHVLYSATCLSCAD